MTSTSSAPPKSIAERVDEITGRDETAILDLFGFDVWDTYDHATDPDEPVSRKISARLSRMLVFAEKLHDGLPQDVAFDAAMGLTIAEVNAVLRWDELLGSGGENSEDDPAAVAATVGKDESTDA